MFSVEDSGAAPALHMLRAQHVPNTQGRPLDTIMPLILLTFDISTFPQHY